MKTLHIQNNNEVHITCGNLAPPDDSVYLQIQGKAAVVADPEKKAKYWNSEWTRYFQSPEDPNFIMVEISPYRIELYGPESFEPQVWER